MRCTMSHNDLELEESNDPLHLCQNSPKGAHCIEGQIGFKIEDHKHIKLQISFSDHMDAWMGTFSNMFTVCEL